MKALNLYNHESFPSSLGILALSYRFVGEIDAIGAGLLPVRRGGGAKAPQWGTPAGLPCRGPRIAGDGSALVI